MMRIHSKHKDPPIILYCVYARKSMEDEESQALSIDSQLSEMKKIIERDGLKVVEIKTESHSAKDSGQRPVFNQMLSEIKNEKYNAILTWHANRLSRNAGDLGMLVDLMDKGLLLEVRTFSQTFSNSPNEKFMLMILGSQAKFENDNKVVDVTRGLRARAEMGLWPSSTPIGYLTPQVIGRPCEKDLDTERAPIIKQMFEKVAYEKYSIYAVWRWLRSIDFRSRGGNLLAPSAVQNILKRTFYYGTFEYPKDSGKWYKGVHPPIITKKLFDDASEAIARTAWKEGCRKPRTWPFAFTRMMHCGSCGSGITADEKDRKRKTTGKSVLYRYYVCTRGRARDCREPYINEKQLMVELRNILDRVSIDLIGMREYLELNIEKYYGFESFMTNTPVPDRSPEKKEYDLRKFAQVIFDKGTIKEQREILQHLTGRLILQNKKIYVDKVDTVTS